MHTYTHTHAHTHTHLRTHTHTHTHTHHDIRTNLHITGKVEIRCAKTKLVAKLEFKPMGWLGMWGAWHRCVCVSVCLCECVSVCLCECVFRLRCLRESVCVFVCERDTVFVCECVFR